MAKVNLTTFQWRALRAIQQVGGHIYYGTDDLGKVAWTAGNPPARLVVKCADDRTFGVVGEPTMTALLVNRVIVHVEGSKYGVRS